MSDSGARSDPRALIGSFDFGFVPFLCLLRFSFFVLLLVEELVDRLARLWASFHEHPPIFNPCCSHPKDDLGAFMCPIEKGCQS